MPDAIRISRGDWSFYYLLSKEQGHSVIFYRMSTIIDAYLFSYSLYTTIFIGYFFLLLSALFISITVISAQDASFISRLIASIGIASLLFNLHNWENILAPWIINSTSLLFCFIISTYTTSKKRIFYMIISILFSALASLSFSNGFLVWICCFFILISHRMFKRASIFLVLGVLFIIYAIKDWGQPSSGVNIGNSILRMFSAVGNGLSFSPTAISTAAPVSVSDMHLLMITGLILILVACWMAFLVRRDIARSSFAISFMLFGLGSCALIAVGRSTLPVEQAASSRYYFSAVPILIGIILILLDLSRKNKLAAFALSGCVAVVFASYFVAFRTEMATAPYRKLAFDRWEKAVESYDTATDAELADQLSSPALIRSLARSLSDAKLGPFSAVK
ncbi:hypothetical protein [Ancylobacter sp.]|uniref:hypothetical protein n=1 Tax=Ancylobacter sp. TaxID=1872567 RepID=UPI003C7BB16F